MRLKEIIEANMYSIDAVPNPGPVASVDPDRLDIMLDPKGNRYLKTDINKTNRSKLLKKKLKIAKATRSPSKQNNQIVGDNVDLTDAGGNSAVNGPFK